MPHFSPVLLAIAFAALVVALTAVARRLPVPTPILQVVAGFLVALVPGVGIPELEPDIVFFVFLPPILWAAAFFTSLREFKANIRPITLLAVGLVLATSVAVAVAARALLPGLPWAVAIALGAIVSPPDAVAATAIVSRLPVPRRVIAILEGESLVNDASALVLYRTAVAAAVTGRFSWGESVVRFFIDAGVGTLVGLLVGWLIIRAMRWTKDALAETVLTLAGPYVAWVAAEQLHVSAVLACVAGGLYVRQHFSTAVGPLSRLETRSVWDLLVFLLNGLIFPNGCPPARWGGWRSPGSPSAWSRSPCGWSGFRSPPCCPGGSAAARAGAIRCRDGSRCSWWRGRACAGSCRWRRRSRCHRCSPVARPFPTAARSS
jgi:Na+/H+ antiporter